MRSGKIILSLTFILAVITGYCHATEPHQFPQDECIKCHVGIEEYTLQLKKISSSDCLNCHKGQSEILSHPLNFIPDDVIPEDMPLENSELSCITCHFVHPFSIKAEGTFFLLRRSGKGAAFCSACHELYESGHTMFENIHFGSYKSADILEVIDEYTLRCIECHDNYFKMHLNTLDFDFLKSSLSHFNHPVGASYSESSAKGKRKFQAQSLFPKEIRLFNGKIGCGTCHNVYSKEKSMLVLSNKQSDLCRSCHVK